MTTFQKVIKYVAIAFAISLSVSIIGGILGVVSLFGGLNGDEITGEIQTYSVGSDINCLEIEFNAADLRIEKGEEFSIESNLKKLKVEEKNGSLFIKDTTKSGFFGFNSYENAVITIYVPEGTVFERIHLIAGAGKVTVGTLSAETMDLEFGAGEVKIDRLIATASADFSGGAGRITVSGGSLNNLEMDMGVGEFNLTSALSGTCKLDMGVGEANITLIGSKDDYRLDIEKGLGSISVDGKDVFDYSGSGNGANRVEIQGGVGSIDIKFSEVKE